MPIRRRFPDFLGQSSCRIANPAQSFQALTVGSISSCVFEDDDWRSFAIQAGEASAFSRAGLGIWGAMKPEVAALLQQPGDVHRIHSRFRRELILAKKPLP
jgi:hypothetical protein